MQRFYLDNAATTPLSKEVIDAMMVCFEEDFGNPSSTHTFGRAAKAQLEASRRKIAESFNCSPGTIYFTSGGTEANNLALKGAVNNFDVQTIITTKIEHTAVLNTIEYLEAKFHVQKIYLSVDDEGQIDLEELESLLNNHQKVLVSLMHANNEIGTLHPLDQIVQLCRKYDALIHSDTVQTIGQIPIDLKALQPDFITGSAHKIHGPKGSGFLYINPQLEISPLIHGGGQEKGMRSGTENVAGITGLAEAVHQAVDNQKENHEHIKKLKSSMFEGFSKLSGIDFLGSSDLSKSLHKILNVSFPPMKGSEMFLFNLDLQGIAVSGGSACGSGANVGSHVLDGIGADPERPNARFSFSRFTEQEAVDTALSVVSGLIEK